LETLVDVVKPLFLSGIEDVAGINLRTRTDNRI